MKPLVGRIITDWNRGAKDSIAWDRNHYYHRLDRWRKITIAWDRHHHLHRWDRFCCFQQVRAGDRQP